ncbi:MAG: hypothetical protein RL338_592 [Chloroflexota bacterium]
MPVSLALVDFVPVLLTAVGLRLLWRLVGAADARVARWAALGATLVVAGGLAKAAWKLIVAVGGPDLPILYAALYPGLALGYLLVAAAAVAAAGAPSTEGSRGTRRPWLPAALGLGLLLPFSVAIGPEGGRLVPLAWLVTGGSASIALDLVLARRALAGGLGSAATLLIAHVVATLALQALARPADQSVALQWVQELLNCATQGAFVVAVAALARHRPAAREAAPRTS